MIESETAEAGCFEACVELVLSLGSVIALLGDRHDGLEGFRVALKIVGDGGGGTM